MQVSSPNEEQPVPRLATITLAYSIEEDRVRLDGLSTAGETLTLWLTARLLNRLVPHLLARQPGTENLTPDSSPVPVDAISEAETKAEPVQCAPGSPDFLVASVDLKSIDNRLLLVFKDRADIQCATLCLRNEALPQWNLSIRQCFELGGWLLDVFEQRSTSSGVGVITIH